MREKLADGRTATTYEFPLRPEKKSLAQFMYDKQTGQVMGRTTKNWGQLILFYLAFYTVLAALFAICMQGLLATMNHQFPKWQQDASLIGTNPGVGYRPIPEEPETTNSIRYSAANRTAVNQWVNRLNNFLSPYSWQTGGGKNERICDFETPHTDGKVCAFDVTNLGACSYNKGYGYNQSAPCIFIKLNRIYGWVPEYYDNIDTLPDEMPAELKEHIGSLPVNQRKQVWVSCMGLHEADKNATGTIDYYPQRGLPSYYYPYTNQPGYLSPLVAIKFNRPAVKTDISVECRAWAKNVIYRGGHRDRQGSILVTLHIE